MPLGAKCVGDADVNKEGELNHRNELEPRDRLKGLGALLSSPCADAQLQLVPVPHGTSGNC
jgi:hypothetical protein